MATIDFEMECADCRKRMVIVGSLAMLSDVETCTNCGGRGKPVKDDRRKLEADDGEEDKR